MPSLVESVFASISMDCPIAIPKQPIAVLKCLHIPRAGQLHVHLPDDRLTAYVFPLLCTSNSNSDFRVIFNVFIIPSFPGFAG